MWLLVLTAAAVQNVKHELWPRTCSLFCGCSAHSGHNTCQKTTMWETRKWVKIQLGVQTLNNSLPAAPRSEQQATRKVWSQTGSQQKEESNPVLNICVSLLQVCWPVDADSLPDFFFFFFFSGMGGCLFSHAALPLCRLHLVTVSIQVMQKFNSKKSTFCRTDMTERSLPRRRAAQKLLLRTGCNGDVGFLAQQL